MRALRRAGFRCQTCGCRSGLQVHHNSYENLFGEADEDLVVLCDRCHDVIERLLRGELD